MAQSAGAIGTMAVGVSTSEFNVDVSVVDFF